MAHAHDFMRRGFQMPIRDDDQIDAVARFNVGDVDAFFVEQEGAHVNRNLAMQGAGVFFHRLFFDDAQDVQRGRFGAADVTGAGAARAGDIARFSQRRAQALARQLKQAKTADLAGLHACAVVMQCIAQAVFHFALVLGRLHVNEVDHDQAAQVAQAQLAGDLVGGFAVGAESRFLDVAALGGAAGVDVNRHQRFGVVDDDSAAGRQGNLT